MRLTPLLPLLLAASVRAAAPPPAPPPPAPLLDVQGRDDVLIGRIYWKSEGKTEPIARFGTVLGDKPHDTTVALGAPVGGTLTVTARRAKDRSAKLTWTLAPSGESGLSANSGSALVTEGSVGHVPLQGGSSGELFASLETGRASTFNVQRLWDHFGVVTDASRFAAAAQERASAPSMPMVAGPQPPPQARGGSMTLTCEGGSSFALSTGSGHGKCSSDVSGDRLTGATCDDGDGNSARATCTVNGGRGACVSNDGTGSCAELR